MSRVGKNPVAIPSGVSVEIANQVLKAKGKLGELSLPFSDRVKVNMDNNQVTVSPADSSKQSRMMWGTIRNLVSNIVKGVHEGFSIKMDINGVGYRATVQGNELVLQLGFSHEVKFQIPAGVTIKCEKPTSILVQGIDRRLIGQVAAEIRSFRPPEPYKGKGIKYENEVIVRKEGKKK